MEKSQRKARFARWTLTRRAGGARPAGFTRSGLRPSLIHPAGRFHSKFLNYFLITWSHIIDKCTSWLCADILSGRSEFQKKITVKFLGLQKYFLESRQKLLTRRKKNGIISREIKKNSPFSPCRTASLVNIFLLPQWVKCEARSFSSCILFCPAFFSEVNYNSNKRYSRQ